MVLSRFLLGASLPLWSTKEFAMFWRDALYKAKKIRGLYFVPRYLIEAKKHSLVGIINGFVEGD